MRDKFCEECGSENTYWHEEHPGTGMDEMVLRCSDCEGKKQKPSALWWRWFHFKEMIAMWWSERKGRVGNWFMRTGRSIHRTGTSRCTWCGSQPGFASCYKGGKGLRCSGLGRNCEEQP